MEMVASSSALVVIALKQTQSSPTEGGRASELRCTSEVEASASAVQALINYLDCVSCELHSRLVLGRSCTQPSFSGCICLGRSTDGLKSGKALALPALPAAPALLKLAVSTDKPVEWCLFPPYFMLLCSHVCLPKVYVRGISWKVIYFTHAQLTTSHPDVTHVIKSPRLSP